MNRNVISLFIGTILVVSACEKQHQNNPYPQEGHGLTTESLVDAVCGNCHLTPKPQLFSQEEWQQRILPNMGRRLGIRTLGKDPLNQSTMMDALILRTQGVYPDDTLISDADWQRIKEYYLELAPRQADAPQGVDSVAQHLPGFLAHSINNLPADPTCTLVKIDTVTGTILWGSATGDLMEVDTSGKVLRQLELPQAPTDWQAYNEEDYFTAQGTIGNIEEPVGALVRTKGYESITVLDKLLRPQRFVLTDLDQSGKVDFVVAETGNQTGRLTWYQANDTSYKPYVIKNAPGFLDLKIQDYNGDKRLDVLALQTHGDERLSVFLQGPGYEFQEELLLRFPATYGSSSYQMIDFNQDGLVDILHTAGEPSTFKAPLRNYHGIRVFINQDGAYKEQVFLPLYGTRKAVSADFDEDGDLDIVAISFNPDFTSAQPLGFVYFQNQGNLQFTPYTFYGSDEGRWSALDIGDLDGDGDIDIVLGSYLQRPAQGTEALRTLWTKNGHHVLFLENTASEN